MKYVKNLSDEFLTLSLQFITSHCYNIISTRVVCEILCLFISLRCKVFITAVTLFALLLKNRAVM